MKVIDVKNITFKYGSKNEVIKDLSLEINKGEFVTILGHNGSGKSTLAKLLMGLLEVNSGSIYINNLLMNSDNIDKIREDIGIVFQNPDNQFVGVTVKDDIAFGLENRLIPYEEMCVRVNKYAKLVGMEEYLEYNPEELSGGQKQRVAIAGVLAFEPNIIIFDEATSMLDPKGTKEVLETIKSLRKDKTIISITHDLNEAILSDRVVVINEGKIILDGKPEEVFKEKDKLKEASLDITEAMKLYNLIKDSKIKNKEELEAIIWELIFQK